MSQRIVLIGAGSANFGLGTLGDIFNSDALAGSEIVLHDINPQALARVERIAFEHLKEHNLPFTVTATTNRQEALQGATFCIISIEVGRRFDLWEQDWRVPQQYGIRQVYGENGGPGGLFHAMRIIPPILDICGDIMRICPDAHVFNFSNPMSRICLTVKRKYPALKLTGLCHEIASLHHHLPMLLDTTMDNIEFKAGGLNHFSVLLEVRYKDSGKDAYPDVRARAREYFEHLPTFVGMLDPNHAPEAEETFVERGLFMTILERFGYLPITTDSHFGEYISWAHSVVDHKGILDFYNWYKAWCLGPEPELRISGTSERVIPMIEGIVTDSGQAEDAANVMNDGLIDNLPHDLVVEVPAKVDKNGVHGVPLGALPKGLAGLMNNQAAVLDLTAEAILQGSRELALQALLVDPVVDNFQAAEKTLDTLLKYQKEYLGYIH